MKKTPEEKAGGDPAKAKASEPANTCPAALDAEQEAELDGAAEAEWSRRPPPCHSCMCPRGGDCGDDPCSESWRRGGHSERAKLEALREAMCKGELDAHMRQNYLGEGEGDDPRMLKEWGQPDLGLPASMVATPETMPEAFREEGGDDQA